MKNIDDKPRDTGLAAALILMLITWFTANTTWVIPAIVVLILTMTVPVVFKPLSVVWFGLANLLGHVVSTVILSVLFFAVRDGCVDRDIDVFLDQVRIFNAGP